MSDYLEEQMMKAIFNNRFSSNHMATAKSCAEIAKEYSVGFNAFVLSNGWQNRVIQNNYVYHKHSETNELMGHDSLFDLFLKSKNKPKN